MSRYLAALLAALFVFAIAHPVILGALVALALGVVAAVWGVVVFKLATEARRYPYRRTV